MQYQDLNITKFPQSGFHIQTSKELNIYIDPFRLPQDHPKADVLLISHEHFDHFDPASIAKIVQSSTQIFTTQLVAEQFTDYTEQITVLEPSSKQQPVKVNTELALTTRPAYNVDKFKEPGKPFHPPENKGLGFVLSIGAERATKIYHMGDTDFLGAEQQEADVDILMLPVSGTFVMTAQEAATACNTIKPQLAIPMHYDAGIVGSEDNAQQFVASVQTQVKILTAN